MLYYLTIYNHILENGQKKRVSTEYLTTESSDSEELKLRLTRAYGQLYGMYRNDEYDMQIGWCFVHNEEYTMIEVCSRPKILIVVASYPLLREQDSNKPDTVEYEETVQYKHVTFPLPSMKLNKRNRSHFR